MTFCALLPFFQTPAGRACSEFSTGHANSPCTIVIGKAHVEKVTVPARPYRMLNNLVFNKRIDFDEDLSGENTALAPVSQVLRSMGMWEGVYLL